MIEYQKCKLCPRECKVNRLEGQLGFCKNSSTLKVARASLHYFEEPCLSGENGSGAIFFSGCSLKCIYCQNHEISEENFGKEITVNRLAEIFLSLQKQGANNINLVTPTHFVPSIIEALQLAKQQGLTLPIIYNSSGYESLDTIKLLDGLIDIYLPDFKYFDNTIAHQYSKVKDYQEKAMMAIDLMFKQVGKPKFNENGLMVKGVIVRHLLLPKRLDDAKKTIAYLYQKYGDDIYLSIMNQYTPLPQVKDIPLLNQKVDDSEYDELIDYALDLGVKNAYIQEGETQKESFIPKFDTTGV